MNVPVPSAVLIAHLSAQTARLLEAAKTDGTTADVLLEIDDESGWGRWIRIGDAVVSFSYHRSQLECWLYPAHLADRGRLPSGHHVPGMPFEWFANRVLHERIPGLGASDIDWCVTTILAHRDALDSHFCPAAWERTRQLR